MTESGLTCDYAVELFPDRSLAKHYWAIPAIARNGKLAISATAASATSNDRFAATSTPNGGPCQTSYRPVRRIPYKNGNVLPNGISGCERSDHFGARLSVLREM